MNNFLNSKLSKYIFYTLLVVCGFMYWYIGSSLILSDFNILNWQKSTIVLVASQSVLMAIGLPIIFYIRLNK